MSKGGLVIALACALAACKGKAKAPAARDAGARVPARDAADECRRIFDRFHEGLAPYLEKIGARAESADAARARPANQRALAACAALGGDARWCLATEPVAPGVWKKCGGEPAFSFVDPGESRTRLLGEPVPPEESARRVGELAGTWVQAPTTPDAAEVTWQVAKDGALTVRRKGPRGASSEEKRQLVWVRERQLGLRVGASTQFIPFHRDGKRLYLSYTSGAMVVPVADEKAFVVDEGVRARWIVFAGGPECEAIDAGTATVEKVPCGFREQGGERVFAYEDMAWPMRGRVLIHPRMEVFARK